MKRSLFTIMILIISACGGSSSNENSESNTEGASSNGDNADNNVEVFALQNIRFDAQDFYNGETISITQNTPFEVQWVSPTSAAYSINLHLTTNNQPHNVTNKVFGIKCGSETFSLCPNATGQVDCEINDNNLTCAIGSDFLGSENFQVSDQASLSVIIEGCNAMNSCDLKTFSISLQSNTAD
ncbi:MAG: hypothetical protein ABJG28_09635 [Nonlabens ulvanivorans]|uniref:hypothetical protein n=1 Tax=Nonlabens ulvanivorans TaxID=906888 RepID=UPI003264F37D